MEQMKQRYYRPREIAKLGLIEYPLQHRAKDKSNTNYTYIIRLIKEGKLRAENYSRSEYSPYYMVSESEINRYNQTLLQQPEEAK